MVKPTLLMAKLISFVKKNSSAILLSLLFTLLFSYYSINRHLTYNSHVLDLGIFTQTAYLYSVWQTPYSSYKHMVILGDHFDPIMFFIGQIYKFFPSSEILLFLQALFVSLSCMPIFLIAKDKLKDFNLSFLITLGYISAPSILRAIGFDFHPGTMSLLPLSVMLYAWYFKQKKTYWFTLLISILFKEDVTFFIFGLGLYQLFTKQKINGVLSMVFAVFSFYLIKFQIMPAIWPNSDHGYLDTSVIKINNPLDILLFFMNKSIFAIEQIYNSPIKLATIDFVYRQFGFLSILSPLSWLTVAPYLFFRFTSNLTYLWGSEFHNNAPLTPFLAVSTILAIDKLKTSTKIIRLFLIFFMLTGGLAPESFIYKMIPTTNQAANFSYINSSLHLIPTNAAVSAQTTIAPHLSNRKKIYLFPEILDAEYIVLDPKLDSYPLSKQDLNIKINSLTHSTQWKIWYTSKSLIIYRKIIVG